MTQIFFTSYLCHSPDYSPDYVPDRINGMITPK